MESLVINILVTGQDLTLEFFGVLVPQLSSLSVERRVTSPRLATEHPSIHPPHLGNIHPSKVPI
jgi:hypothetical protein